MKRLWLGLMVLCILFSACGCSRQEYERRSDTSSTLYIGEVGASFPTTFMPWFSRDGIAPTIASMVYSTLLEYDEENDQYHPNLASEWCYLDKDMNPIVTESGEVDYDRLEQVYGDKSSSFMLLRFRLNPDATWSDGVPVTVDDIYFTFDLAANQKLSNHAGALAWVNDLMHKYDQNTGRLRRQGIYTYETGANEKGYPIAEQDKDTVFYFEVSKVLGAITPLVSTVLVLPRHIYADIISLDNPINSTSPTPELSYAYQHPVGCGAFALDRAETNSQEIVLRRREDYHRKDENGDTLYKVDKLKFILYQDVNVAIYALKKGHIDVLDASISANYASLFEGQSGIQLLRSPGTYTQCLVMNINAPTDRRTSARDALSNITLREAIALAIDEQALIDNVLNKSGVTVPSGLIARDSALYNPGAERMTEPMDVRLERANALLDALYPSKDAAGYRLNGHDRLSFQVLGSPHEQEVISYLQVLLQKIGVEIKFAAKGSSPENTYLYGGDFDMTIQGVVFTASNVDTMMNAHFSNLNRSSNYGRLSEPEITKKINAMRATLNRNAKYALIRELEEMIADTYYKLPLYCQDVISVARTDRFSGWALVKGSTAFNLDSLRQLTPAT